MENTSAQIASLGFSRSPDRLEIASTSDDEALHDNEDDAIDAAFDSEGELQDTASEQSPSASPTGAIYPELDATAWEDAREWELGDSAALVSNQFIYIYICTRVTSLSHSLMLSRG